MNSTPSSERIHIGFFGATNAGKSSLVNALTNQEISVVSDVKGTTTDPVTKTMELLPLGPVVIYDTPGFDDTGKLGELRIKRTKRILENVDIAILVIDAKCGLSSCDKELIKIFEENKTPYLKVFNKCDEISAQNNSNDIFVSAKTGENLQFLKNKIGQIEVNKVDRPIISDMLKKGDIVVLVTPIDESAPAGRMILPQVQTIRDILDANGIVITTRETELSKTLESLSQKPRLVITDSQAFRYVSEIIPEDVMLTSFSILMARKKGFLKTSVEGVSQIGKLKDGDKILIAEACTHHRQCGDIGTVKLPKLLEKVTAKKFQYETTSGKGFPEDLSGYSLILHCGGCMITEREMLTRLKHSKNEHVPITNYGIALAYLNGILPRSIELFSDIAEILVRK